MNKVSFENYDPEKATEYGKIRKFRECIDMLAVLCNNSEFKWNDFFDNDELLKEITYYLEKCFGVGIQIRGKIYDIIR
jgi:hypothetical protein